ncbi:hypothetical protein CTZ28_16575 [Streptomyces shenzhenensis]|uniref:Uncharacterized protein n=1 Tax=Streptomyces shenzhenensis TaxID=943815 RepID=A0A3M0IES8_9ACTN|nr:hypothetical protein CTZ28_16575 [Streptomyces shenzhenensis]
MRVRGPLAVLEPQGEQRPVEGVRVEYDPGVVRCRFQHRYQAGVLLARHTDKGPGIRPMTP